MKKRNAFTLIELLAIIVILAIIAIIVTIAYNAIVRNNRVNLDRAIQNNIERAAVAYCATFACVQEGSPYSDDRVTIGHLTGGDEPLLDASGLRSNEFPGLCISDNSPILIRREGSYNYSAEFNMRDRDNFIECPELEDE